MTQRQPNNAHTILTQLAAIRGREQSCSWCGKMEPTLPKGKANLCLGCMAQVSKTRRQGRTR